MVIYEVLPYVSKSPSICLQAGDCQVKQVGEFDVDFICGDQIVTDTVHVIDGTKGLLLSWYTAKDLMILPQNYPAQQTIRSLGVSEIAHVNVHETLIYC